MHFHKGIQIFFDVFKLGYAYMFNTVVLDFRVVGAIMVVSMDMCRDFIVLHMNHLARIEKRRMSMTSTNRGNLLLEQGTNFIHSPFSWQSQVV